MSNKNSCASCGHDSEACGFDETYRRAKEIIGFKERASEALLQADLKISYATAAKILDSLEVAGLVGRTDGSGPRTVSPELITFAEKSKTIDMPQLCPVCASEDVAKYIYGRYEATPESSKLEKEGKIRFGGCDILIDGDTGEEINPEFHCNACKYEWRAETGRKEAN